MRRLALLFASTLAAALAGAPSAHAGVYEVYACGGAAGAAQNAFAAVADPNMSAYSICPPTSAPGTGIVTKATSNGGFAGYFQGAYQIFEAPPGAGLESVTFNIGVIRLARYWTTGIVSYDGNFNVGDGPYGCYANLPGCGVGTPSFSIPVTVGLGGHSRFRFETRCGNVAGCDLSASSFSPANRALFSGANVVVRVRDSSLPAIVPRSGALWGDGWHRGVEDAWSSYYDNVGVMITRMWVDGQLRDNQDYRLPGWPGHVGCDFTRRRPCSDINPGSLTLDTRTLSEGEHTVRIEAVDTAENVAAIQRTILVDNTLPPRPAAVSVAGGEGWRAANRFRLTWSAAPEGPAPLAAAHYRLCESGPGGKCVEGVRAGDVAGGIDGIAVPEPGDYELRVWLEDAAGNQDAERAGGPVHLRFDDAAPSVVFDAPSRRDPTLLSARIADAESGVSSGTIEIRRRDGGPWHDLEARLSGGRLIAHVDDENLPDGDYVARAIASDVAGNERVTSDRSDGDQMELTLPLRTPTVVALRASCPGAPRCRSGRAGAGSPGTVRAGRTVVRGSVRALGGVPVAGALLAVTEHARAGLGPRRLGPVRTGDNGAFSLRLAAGPSRTVRFRHAGSELLKPATAELRLLAPARSAIAVDRRLVSNGKGVTFRGRLLGAPIPDGGKLIDLQAFFRRRWRTFATPRTSSRGEWSYRYRFEATTGTVRYRFRARIRREAAYPYELGHSRVIRVTVVG